MFALRALAYPLAVAGLPMACAGQQQAAQLAATAPPAQTVVATVAPSSTAVPSPTPGPTSTPLPTAVPAPTTAPTIAATPTTGTKSLAGQALVAALRQGGYVIFFRHTATNRTQTDSDLSRCKTQRNLNTNTMLVSHGFNITVAAEISIGEGKAAIFAPENDSFRLVARVEPKEWSVLADAAGAGRGHEVIQGGS